MQGCRYASPVFHDRSVVYAEPDSERVCRITLITVALLLSFGGVVAVVIGVGIKARECNPVKKGVTERRHLGAGIRYDTPSDVPYEVPLSTPSDLSTLDVPLSTPSDVPYEDPYDTPSTLVSVASGGSAEPTHVYDTHYDWTPSTAGSVWHYDDDWMDTENENKRSRAPSNDEKKKCERRRGLGASMIPALLQAVMMLLLGLAWCGRVLNSAGTVVGLLSLPTAGSILVVTVYLVKGMFFPFTLGGFAGIVVGNIILCSLLVGDRTGSTFLYDDDDEEGPPPTPRRFVVYPHVVQQHAPLMHPTTGRPSPYGYSSGHPSPVLGPEHSTSPMNTWNKPNWN